jgi:nitrogen fixation protein
LVNAPGTRHPALDLRAQAFPRQNHVSAIRANDSPPQPMTDATAALSPQTGFPATDEARTHLGRLPTSPDDGLRVHDPLRSLPATAALPATDEARTHLGRLPSSPDDVLRVHAPLRSLPATAAFPATDEARTHLGRLPSSPDDDLRVHAPIRSLPATAALPATDEARTHLGRLPSSPDDGLRVHAPLRSLPATATFPATDEARTHLGRKAPTCPPTTGLGPLLPLLPLPAVSPYPFPKRHTSPVMTNDRLAPLVLLLLGQNTAVMAPPSASQYPAECPAALPVPMSASLPLHPDILFHPAPNAKTREAQGLAGFGPGAFLPLTCLLCHTQKNKSRTFF